MCRQDEAARGRRRVDSDPAERVGHGGPTPDWPGGQEGPPEQGGQRADRYVFTADPEKPTPARGA